MVEFSLFPLGIWEYAVVVVGLKENVNSIVAKVLALCDDENFSEAGRLLQEALAQHPEDVGLLTAFGIVQSKLDLDEEAESLFRKALRIDSHNENAVCALGRLLDSSLRTEEALDLLRTFLNDQPQSHCAVDDMCRILFSEGQAEESLRIAEQHALRYPSEVDAYAPERYVLARMEDVLCFEYEGEEDSPEFYCELLTVFVKQFELILRMEKELGERVLRDAGLHFDLQEDIVRLAGELEYLIQKTEGVAWSGKDSMMKRAAPLLEIGIERRKASSLKK